MLIQIFFETPEMSKKTIPMQRETNPQKKQIRFSKPSDSLLPKYIRIAKKPNTKVSPELPVVLEIEFFSPSTDDSLCMRQ